MAGFAGGVETQEELRQMAMQSDCGLVDTESNRIEAKQRIKTRRQEMIAREAAKERDMYGSIK